MTYKAIMERIDALADMTNAQLPAAIEELSDIFMRNVITPQQARSMMGRLREVCPNGTEAGIIRSNVLVETGVGESMEMLMSIPDNI